MELFTNYPDIVTVEQLCEMLNVGKNTAYRLLGDGSIKSVRIGKTHKVLKTSVIAFLERASA